MSTKQLLASGLLVVVLGAIGYFGYNIYQESNERQEAIDQRQTLPAAMLQTTGGGDFTLTEAPKDRPVILMFFSPTCQYCQAETESIMAHETLTDTATVLMVSAADRSMLQAYAQQYGLNGDPNVKVLRDLGGQLFKEFGVKGVPRTFVYDANRSLVRDFEGEASAEALFASATSSEPSSGSTGTP
jgi:thiol-disulfide isomerase/thioredoxin